jgi:hypothetical protein
LQRAQKLLLEFEISELALKLQRYHVFSIGFGERILREQECVEELDWDSQSRWKMHGYTTVNWMRGERPEKGRTSFLPFPELLANKLVADQYVHNLKIIPIIFN